jgi:predicted ATP-dependent serine protease
MIACTRRLIEFVKGARTKRDMSAILINQVATGVGSNQIRHMVDVALNLEVGDEGIHILDSSKKNRFGPSATGKLLLTNIGFSSMQ